MATRVTSTRFVGRGEELVELASALADAASSHPSLAFVAGESGVGKSRLVEELAARARENGSRVLSGDCVELGESELPYAPLVAALRPLVRAGDEALAALPASQREDLATIVPGLGSPAGAGHAEQARVFEALLALLETLGEERPVLLVIEDVHWADSSTRHFLGFLSRTLCSERLLVVATYRTDELHRRHPLRPLLAELSRDRWARMVELPALTRAEMGEQLEDILGAPPAPDLVERLYARSEGNPLFTEELLAAGLDGRGALPPTLRDALMLRVDALSPAARTVLRWLACQPADEALLAELSGLGSEPLRDAIREAVSSHIVVAGSEGSYDFRHALLGEVVYDDLLPGERADLHGAVARALEQRLEDEPERAHMTARVAHHWLAAGDQPAAFAASVRAAGAAERVNAFGEALRLYERALALWERVPDPEERSGGDQVELLLRAANAADLDGDAVRQEALLSRALELVDADAEPRAAARVLERMARAEGSLGHQDEALVTIERALALLPDGDRSRERAALLAAGARTRMLQSRYAEAAERAEEALRAARELGGDRTLEVRSLNSLGVARGGLGRLRRGRRRPPRGAHGSAGAGAGERAGNDLREPRRAPVARGPRGGGPRAGPRGTRARGARHTRLRVARAVRERARLPRRALGRGRVAAALRRPAALRHPPDALPPDPRAARARARRARRRGGGPGGRGARAGGVDRGAVRGPVRLGARRAGPAPG